MNLVNLVGESRPLTISSPLAFDLSAEQPDDEAEIKLFVPHKLKLPALSSSCHHHESNMVNSEIYRRTILASAKSVLNDRCRPENVFNYGDDSYYASSADENSNDQWILFDFLEDVCICMMEIKTHGNLFNPKQLRIEAIVDHERYLIAEPTFPNEDSKTYKIYAKKYIHSRSILIRMSEGNYCSGKNQYQLILNEVGFFSKC